MRHPLESEELAFFARRKDPVVCRSCALVRTLSITGFCTDCRADNARHRARVERVRGQHYGGWAGGRSNVPPAPPDPPPIFDEDERAAIADALQKENR